MLRLLSVKTQQSSHEHGQRILEELADIRHVGVQIRGKSVKLRRKIKT